MGVVMDAIIHSVMGVVFLYLKYNTMLAVDVYGVWVFTLWPIEFLSWYWLTAIAMQCDYDLERIQYDS